MPIIETISAYSGLTALWVIGVFGTVFFILAIINQILNKQWGWLIFTLILPPIGLPLYGIVQTIKAIVKKIKN